MMRRETSSMTNDERERYWLSSTWKFVYDTSDGYVAEATKCLVGF